MCASLILSFLEAKQHLIHILTTQISIIFYQVQQQIGYLSQRFLFWGELL